MKLDMSDLIDLILHFASKKFLKMSFKKVFFQKQLSKRGLELTISGFVAKVRIWHALPTHPMLKVPISAHFFY